MIEDIDRFNAITSILKNETKCKILTLIHEEVEVPVKRIRQGINHESSYVSNLLGDLKTAGYIDYRKEGRNNIYFISGDKWDRLIKSVKSFIHDYQLS